jgi:hypothetical protein
MKEKPTNEEVFATIAEVAHEVAKQAVLITAAPMPHMRKETPPWEN